MNMEIVTLLLSVVMVVELTVLLVLALRKKTQKTITGRRKVYVDSSALMDGRILKIAESGFLPDNLIIPRSVIREMQLVADGKDTEKRARARLGISLVNDLERVVHCNVEILQDELNRPLVDERLIELAKENRGAIITTDYNLEKVAETEGIDVLNVNALAAHLKTEFLSGERFSVRIQTVGSNPKQGVGYLQEGTMVVVDNAKDLVGKDVIVQFIRFVQTASGRMIFAKIPKAAKKTSSSPKTNNIKSEHPTKSVRSSKSKKS